jgi:luciferase family oxidoreductase group 1
MISGMVPLSVLDLSLVPDGGDAAVALARTRDLAQHVERLGYHRFWLAEHHNMPGIASAATAVVIAHVAASTSSIRVGSGGVMLPNHAPLVIAEQFGTLAALHPGRIDLGVGRAPGTDPATTLALRRDPAAVESFADDVAELLHYFEPARPGQRVRAMPGEGLRVPVWILGSSTFGAQLAAALGLPFAFASHFAPQMLGQALRAYREGFTPSGREGAPTRPYVMLGVNVVGADTDAEAEALFTTIQQIVVGIRRGERGRIPPPRPGYADTLAPWERAAMQEWLACSVVGGPGRLREGLRRFLEATGADELMVSTTVFDHEARRYSFGLLSQARDTVAPVTSGAAAAS